MDKLVLIDGNSLLNRAFYATPVFTTSKGMPTNAIFGFVKLLFKIRSDIKPKYLVVAFDMKAPTFRHNMYDGYKATRKPMPDDLAVQVAPLKNLLSAMKIAAYEQEGIEADDILGTLSSKYGVHSYIYTGDRDAYQLVDEKTDVHYTKRGVSDLVKLDVSNFSELNEGLTPKQIIDLKALMGDKSDNIPGVPGVGEKTARELLGKYGSLKEIYAHINEVKESLRAKLTANKELAELSYTLATIKRDCEIDLKLEECVLPDKYDGEVKKLFNELEFKSLLTQDIFAAEGGSAEVKVEYPEKIEDAGELLTATESNDRFCAILSDGGFSVCTGGKIYECKADYEILHAIYSKEKNTVITYDFKPQMHLLAKNGVTVRCNFEDLALINYLCDYNSVSLSLKDLCTVNGYDYAYCAFAVERIYNAAHEKLVKEGMVSLYEEVEKPLVEVLFEMERKGVLVSGSVLEELSQKFNALAEEYQNKIYEGCGITFNINSPAQLGKVLYDKLGIKEVKKKDKFTTAAEVLEKIVDKSPVVSDVLKYRFYQKVSGTYLEPYRALIEKGDGVVHTTYNQTGTTTGRLSSANPNLQNIPIRDDEGKILRKAFVAREGNAFIDADYSQIELRLLAHFSGCKELIAAYNAGEDIHAVTASQVFGVKLDEVTPKMRRAAKAVNFGIIYGISEFGLSKNLNVSTATAKEYISKYFETYSEVREYMQKNVDFAKEHGFVSTITGRRRFIPEIKSSNYNLRQFGERAAMNMPLQGTSADVIKIAMVNVRNALKKAGLRAELILQVHDELVIEAPINECDRAAEILKYEMENAVKLNVPLTVEVHSGKDWYEAK